MGTLPRVLRGGLRFLVAAFAAMATITTFLAAPSAAETVTTPVRCEQPYLPQFAARIAGDIEGSGVEGYPQDAPTANPTLDGRGSFALDYLLGWRKPPDTDGDGKPDMVEQAQGVRGSEVKITRSDGIVTLAIAGGNVGLEDYSWWGDFNGDKRDDIIVWARPPGGSVPAGTPLDSVYAVSGVVPPGVHTPADVGVLLTNSNSVHGWQDVGDQNRDGADDISNGSSSPPAVLSGRTVLAQGPGGRLVDQGPSIVPYDPDSRGLVNLRDGGPPAFVAVHPTAGNTVEVVIGSDPPIRLRTPSWLNATGAGSVTGYVSGTHRIIWLRPTGNRSDQPSVTWDLDDPCALPTHVVRSGDALWGLARAELRLHELDTSAPAVHHYADTLYQANVTAVGPDPNRLVRGTRLVLPTPD